MQGAAADLVLKHLRRCNAILVGEFRLSSGATSHIYIDARRLLGDPEARATITSLLAARIADIIDDVDVIAGLATAGIPWATLLAAHYSKPLAYVRSRGKGHGLGRMVEGAECRGRRILIVDDVATTGGSLLHGVRALRSEGGVVEYALVIVDRGQGARENLAREGVELLSLTTLSEILASMLKSGMITEKEFRSLRETIL
ncbi:MAG: orotate phosphoribosyltransferase [Crenarchaeota archaeon]|nr:orotate phosphoribosyltransferase [Thermoproteota archaeon]